MQVIYFPTAQFCHYGFSDCSLHSNFDHFFNSFSISS